MAGATLKFHAQSFSVVYTGSKTRAVQLNDLAKFEARVREVAKPLEELGARRMRKAHIQLNGTYYIETRNSVTVFQIGLNTKSSEGLISVNFATDIFMSAVNQLADGRIAQIVGSNPEMAANHPNMSGQAHREVAALVVSAFGAKDHWVDDEGLYGATIKPSLDISKTLSEIVDLYDRLKEIRKKASKIEEMIAACNPISPVVLHRLIEKLDEMVRIDPKALAAMPKVGGAIQTAFNETKRIKSEQEENYSVLAKELGKTPELTRAMEIVEDKN